MKQHAPQLKPLENNKLFTKRSKSEMCDISTIETDRSLDGIEEFPENEIVKDDKTQQVN
jgi:hypothetical protein